MNSEDIISSVDTAYFTVGELIGTLSQALLYTAGGKMDDLEITRLLYATLAFSQEHMDGESFTKVLDDVEGQIAVYRQHH